MPMPLSEVLQFEVVQRAKPRILHGHDLLDRMVRWVHTSELVEAAALLNGGELLLTTGLGLAGRGPVAQLGYVEKLAERGAAALVLELGWTFSTAPDTLIDAAREFDMPLVTLHEIVPFVEITEVLQTHLVYARATALNADRDINDLLYQRLLDGGGLSGLVDALSGVLGCPVLIESSTDHQLTWSGLPNHAEPRATLETSRIDTAPIELLGNTWGWLHVADPPEDSPYLLAAALERGPSAAALALLQGPQLLPLRARRRQEFVDDLMRGRFQSGSDLASRAALVDMRVPTDGVFVGFAVGDFASDDDQIALYAAEAIASSYGGLAAETQDCVLGILAIDTWRNAQSLVDEILSAVEELMVRRGAVSTPRIALGQPAHGLESLGRSLREARGTLRLSSELGVRERAVTAAGMDADRILAEVVDDPQVVWLIDDRLGPLIRHDSEHGSDLVGTLWLYLTHGSSKTRTAQVLHLRRQSLYQRLAKIQDLIGAIDDPQRRVSLLLALKAHELRQRRGAH